ncbi:MAG: HypC/HybG/HupF family hydrogenase formation chaperone [bacterium]|nr:HypC/HybG/HupF family hydrogenase formation chaperone [bacterium]
MCLAVPGIIRSITDGLAKVDFGGVEREIALDLLPEAKVGEYILAHAGFALQTLDVEEAEELLALFREIEEAIDAEQRS